MMKIGELAKATHTQAETIRFYEREGLLAEPPRSDGNYRQYGSEHAQRLAFIRQCRSLDMPLADVRALLEFQDDPAALCTAVDTLLDAHIARVAGRISGLRELQRRLADLRARCDGAAAECGIVTGLRLQRRRLPPKPSSTHKR